jgi:hypothetical protein
VTNPWLCESVRLSALWSIAEGAESSVLWESVVGAPPEVRESQPRQGTTRDAGPVGEGAMLELRTAPGRADWLLLPTMTPAMVQAPAFPNVGSVDDAIRLFVGLLFEKAALGYNVPRLALGVAALHPAPDRGASYAELTRLLTTISPKLDGATEFQYQINRPRQSKIVHGLAMNRLSRWSSVVMTGVAIPIHTEAISPSSARYVQTKPIHATRVELDLSSAAERQDPLPKEARLDLLRELTDFVPEILRSGDMQ